MERRQRLLRIGIVVGGTLVEERVIRGGGDVTVGPSPSDTFVVPASDALQRSFTLFRRDEAGWSLQFTRRMGGRVALDGDGPALPLVEAERLASRRGELFSARLAPRGRGRVELGEVAVLFQFVAGPPAGPRPQLPPSLRSSILGNLDGVMVALLGLSLVAHTGFVAYLHSLDLPRTPDIAFIPERVVQHTMTITLPRELAPPKQIVTVGAPPRTPRHVPVVFRGAGGPGAPARPSVEDVRRQVTAVGLLHVLGARGDDGLLADVIRPDPGNNADEVFRHVGRVQVGGPPQPLGPKVTRGPKVVTIDPLRALGPGGVDTGDTVERYAPKPPDIEITLPPPPPGEPPLPVIADEVKRRKKALEACYEREIRHAPTLAGKLTLRFHLTRIGKVSAAEVENDGIGSASLDACLTHMVSGWRFPSLDDEADFSFEVLFQPAGN